MAKQELLLSAFGCASSSLIHRWPTPTKVMVFHPPVQITVGHRRTQDRFHIGDQPLSQLRHRRTDRRIARRFDGHAFRTS
jgi:hypothetical protein